MKTKNLKLVLGGIGVVVVVAAISFAAMHILMTPPDDLDLSRSRATEAGTYVATIAPETGEVKQNELHSWLLTLKTADGVPVEDAAIVVDGGMPQHGHGLPTSPKVTAYMGDGRYRIEGVRFNMSGWWELKLAITAPQGADRITFNLTL